MNIILLSGGSGKRLWPLSNDVRAKQFIKFFDDGHGKKESMVQRIYRNLKQIDSKSNITIASSRSQVSELKNQLGSNISISIEPTRKDTFPAIILACEYLKDKEGVLEEEPIIVCPVDPNVDYDYFKSLKKLSDIVNTGLSNLVLMGIEPTYPSEKYGYIIPYTKDIISKVLSFKEKPAAEIAKEYIAKGALWNGGIFGFKLGYLLKKAHKLIDFYDYDDLFTKYETLNKISFDYAISEKETNISVLRFSGKWEDLGTWNSLTEALASPIIGEGIIANGSNGNHIINEQNVPVLCVGVNNVIVAASREGILVTSKEGSNNIKTYVDQLDCPVMFAEKSWGTFQIIDKSQYCLTIKLTVSKGKHMSYHSHKHKKEIWTIASGMGTVIVNGFKRKVKQADSIVILPEQKHTIIADTDMSLIEIQIGESLDKNDKNKYPFAFDKKEL